MKHHRIIIVGAGFSVHAGLPLAADLMEMVREDIAKEYGKENHFESDLNKFLEYRLKCDHIDKAEPFDYEQFLSFLDMEHFLWLKGSDTWSEEGNESQLMIRRGIMRVIHRRMPTTPSQQCIDFCKCLSPSDWILTFNYDTLIEDTLDYLDIPYRLYPERYEEEDSNQLIVDSENGKDDIVVLKLHGSIDWFDKSFYLEHCKIGQNDIPSWKPRHAIFHPASPVQTVPITEGPRHENDPLLNVYKVKNLEDVFDEHFSKCCPLILSPSKSKIFYINPLASFWKGIQKAGGLNLGLGVIGYSLPLYDEYARQAFYFLINNYTQVEPELELGGVKKKSVKILDYFNKQDSGWKIRKQYSFVNWQRCEVNGTGLNRKSIEWFFS